MGKLKINYKLSTVGWSACGLLGLLMLVLVLPICTSGADAVQNSTSVAQTRAVVNAAATVSVALDSEVTIDVTPTGEGTFASTPTSLTVSTNNQEGYSLYLKTLDATNSMTSTDPNKTNTIQAVSGTPTSASFANNTWGYALTKDAASSATQYAAVPTNDTKIYNEPSTTTGDTYNLTFGAKVSTDLPAGQYANTVQVSVVANPNVISNLTQLVYMQDMTAGICANTGNITPGNEVSKQLIDIRDGKQYWVSKLADQNCWMTQNLALDLKAGQQLTSADTNISVGRTWTVPAEGTTSNEVPQPVSNPSQTEARSWNLGEYVLATPTRGVTCNSAPANGSTNDDGYNSVRPGQTIGENCTDFVNVGELGWKPTYDAEKNGYNKTWTGRNWVSKKDSVAGHYENYTYNKSADNYGFVTVEKGTSAADASSIAASEGNTYDAHYLIGNYYQWNAAVAGTGGADVVSPSGAATDPSLLVDAKDSICPKGWKLPTAGRNTSTGFPFDREDSFYRLLLAYGYPQANQYVPNNGNGYTPIKNGSYLNGVLNTTDYSNLGVSGAAHQNLSLHPLSFVRGGNVHLGRGSMRTLGLDSYYWAATVHTSTSVAYYQDFDRTNFYPSFHGYYAAAFSVRCLAL